MDVGLLYSGGKDSTLAALLLEPHCDVTLLCATFGITDDFEHAMRAATAVGFTSERLDLESRVAREAVSHLIRDGYPRNGIQLVHEHALESAAACGFEAIADGTRRDDRTPTVDRSLAQSIEDRYDVSHLAPLAGFGRTAIDTLATRTLKIESGPSSEIEKGDYESELRALLGTEHDTAKIDEIFPDHIQSRVRGRK